jgi:TonB-dependent starch-binding outer membrane protein SusC
LQGASIIVKGSSNATVSDKTGFFSIQVSDNNAVLQISFTGFLSSEIKIGNQNVVSVKLSVADSKLGEVVVIGYGSQRQRKVTGAIGSINTKDISGVQVTGLDQAIQGRIAGVQVTQNSGEPGGSVSIRIRGVGSINSTNEPLYIVDGVPYGSLNAINPNDIERIDVLKDAASSSIYGSRASNGVVLVTTKRGKAGKLTVSFDAYAGVQNVAKKIDL